MANYLLKHANGKPQSVAIAHDSRNKGVLFCQQSAAVLAANGIKAYLYPQLMPTPALSYAVRHLQCDAGICVTASHNPAKYNGYKAYGSRRLPDHLGHGRRHHPGDQVPGHLLPA